MHCETGSGPICGISGSTVVYETGMKHVATTTALLLALTLGVLPSGQCLSRLLLSYCCCEVPAAGTCESCCAKGAANSAPEKLSTAPSGAAFCTHTVAHGLQASIQQPPVHLASEPPLIVAAPFFLRTVPQAARDSQAHPPDTPIFITVQSFLI